MPEVLYEKQIPAQSVVEVARAAAIAGPVADGRLVPVLILDTRSRPEIAELIRLHKHLGTGDVESEWATLTGQRNTVALVLTFTRPMDLLVSIRFEIDDHAKLVDMIVAARATYLQAGEPGDRLATAMDEPRILVEIPLTGFETVWDELLLDRMTAVIREERGISRRAAKAKAQKAIAEFRQVTHFRMPGA